MVRASGSRRATMGLDRAGVVTHGCSAAVQAVQRWMRGGVREQGAQRHSRDPPADLRFPLCPFLQRSRTGAGTNARSLPSVLPTRIHRGGMNDDGQRRR